MPSDLVFVSRRVVTPEGERPAAVVVRDGMIAAVVDPADAPAGVVEDLGDLALLPGLVDAHVHVNEPGRTEWEGFATATAAAAAGGVTTIVDMPLNSLPPTIDRAALDAKRAAASPQIRVDVAFWGGVVPDNEDRLAELYDAGVLGFKAFLCDSGVPEFGDFPPAIIGSVARRTAELGAPLIVHAEHAGIIAEATAAVAAEGPDPRRYDTWLRGRPPGAEEAAVAAVIDAVEETGARIHVLHLSAATAADRVAAAKAEGLPITAETCPHYLTLAAEDVADGDVATKCAPPIRDRTNQARLWAALEAGTIDAVVSDHSPASPDVKGVQAGDFMTAWGGIASLQLGLPLIWTAAAERGHTLADVVRWQAEGPARVAGITRKGVIAPGMEADLVVFDPDATWMVDPARLHHRHPISPYGGRHVRGAVRTTYLGGEVVARGRGRGDDVEVVGTPSGRLRTRGDL